MTSVNSIDVNEELTGSNETTRLLVQGPQQTFSSITRNGPRHSICWVIICFYQ